MQQSVVVLPCSFQAATVWGEIHAHARLRGVLAGEPAGEVGGQLSLEDCRVDVGVDEDVAHAKPALREV